MELPSRRRERIQPHGKRQPDGKRGIRESRVATSRRRPELPDKRFFRHSPAWSFLAKRIRDGLRGERRGNGRLQSASDFLAAECILRAVDYDEWKSQRNALQLRRLCLYLRQYNDHCRR